MQVSKLSKEQQSVFDEYFKKDRKSIGLDLPLGFGKTFLAICIAIENMKRNKGKTLIVVEKSLMGNWEAELNKHFKDLKYFIFHQSNKKIKDIVQYEIEDSNDSKESTIYLTTIDVVAKLYNASSFPLKYREKIQTWGRLETEIVHYILPVEPYHKGTTRILFSEKWNTIVFDEIQNYNNYKSKRVEGLMCLCGLNRISISGTTFSEPKIEKIFGYYLIMHNLKLSDNLPNAKIIFHYHFNGFNEDLIIRDKKPHSFKINKHFISHSLYKYEESIYHNIRDIMNEICIMIKQAEREGNTEFKRKFSAYLLAALTFLRQSLISCMIPLTKIFIDFADLDNKSELSNKLYESFKQYKKILEDENNICSSRINEILKLLDKHNNQKVIIFTSFRVSEKLISHFIKDRDKYTIGSNHSLNKRKEVITEFENSKNGVLVLTYEIGSVGLNLQKCSVMIISDLWWNVLTTQQAIGRIARQGQENDIDVYFLSSNTGVEKAILDKQKDKIIALDQLKRKANTNTTRVKKIRIMDIIKLLNQYEIDVLNKDING